MLEIIILGTMLASNSILVLSFDSSKKQKAFFCLLSKLMFLSLSCRSFFELMLFFSKEEFVEKPLKDILDSFQVTNTDPVSIPAAIPAIS